MIKAIFPFLASFKDDHSKHSYTPHRPYRNTIPLDGHDYGHTNKASKVILEHYFFSLRTHFLFLLLSLQVPLTSSWLPCLKCHHYSTVLPCCSDERSLCLGPPGEGRLFPPSAFWGFGEHVKSRGPWESIGQDRIYVQQAFTVMITYCESMHYSEYSSLCDSVWNACTNKNGFTLLTCKIYTSEYFYSFSAWVS